MTFDVVVFGAHPDDAEMGMGGTIARLVRGGRSVLIVSLTRGECGTFGSVQAREREAAEAARILGCTSRLLDLPDSGLEANPQTRAQLMRLLRELRPRIVFAPYHQSSMGHHDGAAHTDHLATGASVRDAVKLARLRGVEKDTPAHEVNRLYHYMVPRNVFPTLLVDVSEDYETLERAIRAYSSQMEIERRGSRILEILRIYRRYFGITAGCEYAEAFLCDEPLRAGPESLFEL